MDVVEFRIFVDRNFYEVMKPKITWIEALEYCRNNFGECQGNTYEEMCEHRYLFTRDSVMFKYEQDALLFKLAF